MYSSVAVAICIFLTTALGLPLNSSGLHVSTRRATRSVGDTVRLNCSDPSKTPLYWIHTSVGSVDRTYIYNTLDITHIYRRGGRHSVEVDDSSGSCDLLIKQLSVEDAGTYTCRRDDGDHLEIELIIIVSMPTCESSSDLSDVLVENDCGVEPDLIQLKCKTGYHGNTPPTLEWRHSLEPDTSFASVISNQWISATEIVVINSLTKTSSIHWNETNFICSVNEMEAGERSYGCATRKVSVTYLFNSTESRSFEITDDDEEVNISCVVNTSQTCNYRWRSTLSSTENPVEMLGQTIRLTTLKHDVQDLRCLAECRIRDDNCIVEPLLLKFFKTADVNSSEKINPFISTWLLCVFLVILTILITVLTLKIKRVVRFFKEKHQLGTNAIPEKEQLVPHGYSDYVRKIFECLQPDKSFLNRMKSAGVLSDQDFEEDQDRENLLKILTRNINTRRTFNSFLAVLIESDQYFPVVDLTVTISIQQNISRLIECLDVDNGLTDCLFSRGVLSSEQNERLTNKSWWSSFQEQNRELLTNMLPSRLMSDHACKMLMAALVETDQRHVFNFIMDSEDSAIVTKDDTRMLTSHEIKVIDKSSFQLINLIDPRSKFLEALLQNNCITQTHKDRIDVQLTKRDKNKELLSIMRRRSYEDFKTFKRTLRDTQKNAMIVKLLEQDIGHVISVHCEINMEPETGISSEHLSIMETKIATHLSDPTILSKSLTQDVANKLNGMHEVGIDMIGATPTGSVIVYFSCQTFQSIVAFKQMVVTGELTRILEELFNRILGFMALFRFNLINRIKLIVSLSETEYRSGIDEARRTIHTDSTSQPCFIRCLPTELLEIILLESMVGIMCVEWMTNVRDNESVSGSYNLFDTVANKTWMSACISLKSVTYQWMHARCLKRGVALKQFFFRRLHEHYPLFSEQLNCRYMFVDCLKKEGIITEEERRSIMEADGDVATRTYEDIPESCWPQMRDSEQMLMSNKKLLKCLFERNYSQISQFLNLMEDNCLTHILNYFINNKELFGDVWPLRDAQRNNIIKIGTAIVRNMNILALSEVRGKKKGRGEESGTTDGRRDAGTGSKHPSGTTEGSDGSTTRHRRSGKGGTDRLTPITEYAVMGVPEPLDANIHLDTTIDEFEPDREVPGSTRDSQNLIDLLYNGGCISLLQKQHIEQQPTQQLQNLEMLQLIKNGSIKTFKVALEYFRATNQDDVFDMLNRKYFSEEIQSSQRIIRTYERVMGVAWLEKNIYVVTLRSNIVYFHPDHESNDGSKDGKIELKGMKNPRDMVASKLSRSIFISDCDNRCLWRIQMPGREISRREVDGRPYEMSVSSSDVLVVYVILAGRVYLNRYRSSDVMLMESIPLPRRIKVTDRAVQLSNGNFIISCSMDDDPDVFFIRELSVDGRNFIRNFDPRSIASNRLDYWTPFYLSIDEDENIFIADRDNDRVVLLSSRWTDVQILLNREQHSIQSPVALCYVREKQQLIVGRGGRAGLTYDVRVFNLCPHVPHTDRRTLTNELELIKSVPFDHVESKICDTSNPSPRMPDIQLVERFEVKEGTKESSVEGVTWLDNKIYVVCRESNRVHVFPDQEPFNELKEEEITIKGMKQPSDMSASKVSRSIFISDHGNRCLWRVQMAGRGISRWRMDGRPRGLSITSSDELIVVVDREDRWHLDIFSCSDVNRKQSIPLSAEIKDVRHAVQSSNDNAIILHSTKNIPDVYQISELPIDGTNFIRTFDPRSVQTMNLLNWSPNHLSFDDDGRLFVVDHHHNRVYLLSSQLTDLQILLKRYQHQLRRPYRLCYVREKQQLIVGQTGMAGEPGPVSVFNVPPQQHPMNIEHEQEPNNEQ